MELTAFLHAGTNSCKLESFRKILKVYGQNWVRPVWWWDCKIDCICKWTDEITDFLHADTDSQKLKIGQMFFGWAWSKMIVASLVMGLKNWLYLKNEQMQ